MISCDEAVLICNKSQYQEASLSEKFKLKLHILFCSACGAFSKRNKRLSELFRKSRLRVLSDSDKVELRQQVKNRL